MSNAHAIASQYRLQESRQRAEARTEFRRARRAQRAAMKGARA